MAKAALQGRKLRKKRTLENKTEAITTIASKKIKEKQNSPTCYRFSDFDKAEIAIAVSNLQSQTNSKITPAKLLRSLVRINNAGNVDDSELIKMAESL